jgi:hypothetical protein
VRRGVAKQPSSRPHKDRIIQREDGFFTRRDTKRIEDQAAICAKAIERDSLAKRQRRKRNSMYTMPIADYHHLRKRNV